MSKMYVEECAVELEERTFCCDTDSESDVSSVTLSVSDTSDSPVQNLNASSTFYEPARVRVPGKAFINSSWGEMQNIYYSVKKAQKIRSRNSPKIHDNTNQNESNCNGS